MTCSSISGPLGVDVFTPFLLRSPIYFLYFVIFFSKTAKPNLLTPLSPSPSLPLPCVTVRLLRRLNISSLNNLHSSFHRRHGGNRGSTTLERQPSVKLPFLFLHPTPSPTPPISLRHRPCWGLIAPRNTFPHRQVMFLPSLSFVYRLPRVVF